MDPALARPLAHFVAWGRVGIGASAVVAPTLVARPWIGPEANSSGSRLLARTMGGRDLALGFGALRALRVSDAEARPWMALGGMADAVDALATVLAFGSLPRRGRWGILALSTAAAVVSTRTAASLDRPSLGSRSVSSRSVSSPSPDSAPPTPS